MTTIYLENAADAWHWQQFYKNENRHLSWTVFIRRMVDYFDNEELRSQSLRYKVMNDIWPLYNGVHSLDIH
jgi:hypothetical protein